MARPRGAEITEQVWQDVLLVWENRKKFAEVSKRYRPRTITEVAQKYNMTPSGVYKLIKRKKEEWKQNETQPKN